MGRRKHRSQLTNDNETKACSEGVLSMSDIPSLSLNNKIKGLFIIIIKNQHTMYTQYLCTSLYENFKEKSEL